MCVALALAAMLLGSGTTGAQAPRGTGGSGQTVVVEVQRCGFHWLEAGIGAAVAIAAMLAVTGVVLARSRR